MNGETQEKLPLGRWRHFKGGEYQVYGVAIHSETEEEYVVYRPLYGEGKLWIRPLSMWLEEVERDGKKQKRFTYIRGIKLLFLEKIKNMTKILAMGKQIRYNIRNFRHLSRRGAEAGIKRISLARKAFR